MRWHNENGIWFGTSAQNDQCLWHPFWGEGEDFEEKKPYTRQAHKRELHPKPFPPSRTHTQHISIIHTNTEGAMGGQRTVCLPSESSRFFLLFLNIPAVADSCIMGVKTPLKIANKPGGGYSGLRPVGQPLIGRIMSTIHHFRSGPHNISENFRGMIHTSIHTFAESPRIRDFTTEMPNATVTWILFFKLES